MTGRDAFKIWAPAGVKWAAWARPVPFVAVGDALGQIAALNPAIPDIIYMAAAPPNTAVIADMPGPDSVKEGLALAKMGFRPVPLYNGTNGQEGAMALVDSPAIANALQWGAGELEKIKISPDAPPAFLLDSNRTHRYRMDASVFDNSWDIYDQDMPSARYLLSGGIGRVIVRAETIQKDLGKILYKFQKAGIAILFTDGYSLPKEVVVKKPPRKDK